MFGLGRKKVPQKELDWFQANRPHPDETSFTPDVCRLEGRPWCLVFLYDELMQDRRLYDKIRRGSINIANSFTKDRNMVLWKKKVGLESFPIPLIGADKMPERSNLISSRPISKMALSDLKPCYLGRIKGELHAVRPEVMFDLDRYYMNGVEFERKRIRAIIPYHIQQGSVGIDSNQFIATVRCWMWMGIKSHWIDQLDGGYLFKPTGYYVPKRVDIDGHTLGLYYCYTRLEYATNS